MLKKITLFVFSFLLLSFSLKADEGMWIPLLLKKYNISDMQKKGFKLSADDIYSINKASMKDAVMIFGGGCTAELISDKGLLITNHHCGYGAIQSHSSVEHNYLSDGFWAMDKKEELPNKDLTVTFLIRMEDVTKKILDGVNNNMSETERKNKIDENKKRILENATEGTHYKAKVSSFYYGNQYYLFVNEVFEDVRLVGAPNSAIGKFGGDTDNWMWPRHTGDFSLFRIYADKNNKPAKYSPDNVPYKPKKFFPISIKGVKKGDFTMVFGYPGRTSEYIPSFAVANKMKVENPHRIKIRQKKIDIMKKYMNQDPKIRIQYAAKQARVSNAWKKWIGQNKGLKRMHAIEKKKEIEKQFTEWVEQDKKRKEKYGKILSKYEELYNKMKPLSISDAYFYEAGYSLDIVRFINNISRKTGKIKKNTDAKTIQKIKKETKEYIESFFKNYNRELDKELFKEMQIMYINNETRDKIPIKTTVDKIDKYVEQSYKNSIFDNKEEILGFVEEYNPEESEAELRKDPLFAYYAQLLQTYLNRTQKDIKETEEQLDSLNRIWIRALMEMQTDKTFYPDANSTLRVTYGKVDNYVPADAVEYEYYTTLEGIMEKDNPEIYDYKVPTKLKQLYKEKDYDIYGENGKMHVCFTASNHTTGGNSGSPVINAEGQLIGVNFDRNWEGTMSDIMYDPTICRNITLDIRYALFLIDKFAGAKHLIKEMKIIK